MKPIRSVSAARDGERHTSVSFSVPFPVPLSLPVGHISWLRAVTKCGDESGGGGGESGGVAHQLFPSLAFSEQIDQIAKTSKMRLNCDFFNQECNKPARG